MGQKVNPTGIRTGFYLPWKSRWFGDSRTFKEFLVEDIKIRTGLMDKLKLAGITTVEIERMAKSMVVIITVSRPGVVIGRGGTGIEDVKKFILSVMNETRGKVVYANGQPFSTWYASTSGGYQESYTDSNSGYSTPAFWDTKNGRSGWTADAYEKIAGSSWYYKG